MINILHPSYIAKFGNTLTKSEAEKIFKNDLQKLIDKSYLAYANTTTKDRSQDNKTKPKSN